MVSTGPQKEPIRYDWLIKAALRRYYPELATWLVGERPLVVEEVETALAVASIRFADKLLSLRFRSRPPLLLHVEFQTEGDMEMPERIAQYLALILGTLKVPKHKGTEPACVVVYLDRQSYLDDPGRLNLRGALGLKLELSYRVIKLWELDPELLLRFESPGLCPFVPLMAGNPIDLVLKSQQKIVNAPERLASAETKRELLTVLGGLATRVIKDRELIIRLFSEIRLMGENYFFDLIRKEGHALGLEEGRKEGREEGREEGARAEVRRGILLVLRRRFSEEPSALSGQLESVQEVEALERLLQEAAVCADLDAFRVALERG